MSEEEKNYTPDFERFGVEFQDILRRFMEQTDGLSKNSLKRVCNSLAAYPLEDDVVKLVHKEEFDAVDLGKEIQQAKLNMMIESLRLDAENEVKKAMNDKENENG